MEWLPLLTDVLVEVKAGEVDQFGGCSFGSHAPEPPGHREDDTGFCFLFVGLLGIDGPAAFLKPDAQDVDTRLHVLTVGSAATEDTEGSADGESARDPASKPDLQEVLRKHGEGVPALRP